MAMSINDLYLRLNYEQYKNLEKQLLNFKKLETTHRTVEGGYHKAFRIHITDSLILEFQGPLIKAPLEDNVNPTGRTVPILDTEWKRVLTNDEVKTINAGYIPNRLPPKS